MKTSNTWNFRPLVGKIIVSLVLGVMIGTIHVTPALARDNGKHKRSHDSSRYEPAGRGHDSGDRYYDGHGRRVYRNYGYPERVYIPPPVIYVPPPQPGISVFLPPFFIHL